MVNADVILQNLRQIQRQIAACPRAGGAPVQLIAVAKTFPVAAVRAAQAAGVGDIGENYLQEAEEKISACTDLPLIWHFIGRVQKNKASRIAQLFDWVHSVDCLSLAKRLSAARAASGKPLNMFMQVNISAEENKGGVAVEEAEQLAGQLGALPHIQLRGLMVLPAPSAECEQQYEVFCRTARLQQGIAAATGIAMDCLSMGMSADYPQALAAGATHIRLGSALFGERTYKQGTA